MRVAHLRAPSQRRRWYTAPLEVKQAGSAQSLLRRGMFARLNGLSIVGYEHQVMLARCGGLNVP